MAVPENASDLPLAARRTRKEARERTIKTFMASLNQMMPEDESVPLQGKTFRDFEMQAQALKEAVIPTLLEERAALDGRAQVEAAGTCPHCRSDRTYMEKGEAQKEIRAPDGGVGQATCPMPRWPMGSGNTQAAVKCFNKRVKGTDQFWSLCGVEAIMALRALWFNHDQSWEHYWERRSAYGFAQAA